MNPNEKLEQAMALLVEASQTFERPTIVAISPDSPSFLRGNRGGFVYLAIAALKAANGTNQSFKKTDWVRCEDRDWVAGGFEFDDSADTYLAPDPHTIPWWKRKLANALGILIFAVVVGLAIVGFISVIGFAASHL